MISDIQGLVEQTDYGAPITFLNIVEFKVVIKEIKLWNLKIEVIRDPALVLHQTPVHFYSSLYVCT